MPGKIDSSLNVKLDNIEWGEYKLGDLFEIKSNPQLDTDYFKFSKNGEYPYFTRTVSNNGILGYVDYLDDEHKIEGNCLAVGMMGMEFFYIEKDFYAGQFTKRAIPKNFLLNPYLAVFFTSVLNTRKEYFKSFLVRDFEQKFSEEIVLLPTKEGKIDFKLMESVITDIEMHKIESVKEYLSSSRGFDCELTQEEKNIINNYNSLTWQKFNLEALFGKSDRGRRLKSEDRISGTIPFVTAGESDEGISDFIGNEVQIFSENTTTIDMFGSAKYRNYEYGADDHVSIVHTENLNKFASIFVTSAIHKASHNGQFNYGKNFYPKDADELFIMLPELNGNPDFKTMEIIISAIHKIVIKDLVIYVNNKLAEKHYEINNPYLIVNN